MNEYKAYENQTLLDIAAHNYGSIEIVVELALNNNLSVNETLIAGQVIELVDYKKNELVTKSINNRNIIPASAKKIENITTPQGIGFMILENNFKVA
jgi:hypothetical protein